MPMNHEIKSIINLGKNTLTNYPTAEAQQLIHILLQDLLNITRTTILAYPDTKISNSDYNQIIQAIERLKNNEPIQYILGKTEFFDLEFEVSPSVLIPRPETEELVNWIILDSNTEYCRILDIGTGSGCIAVSLAKNILGSKVFAIDVSSDAIMIASNNTRQNQANVEFIQQDILCANLEDLPDNLDVIVSNPPYVTFAQKELMHKNVTDFEPDLALYVEDSDPLIFYRTIAEIALIKLSESGKLFFEINEEYSIEMNAMLTDLGYSRIDIRKDINGKYRMLKAEK